MSELDKETKKEMLLETLKGNKTVYCRDCNTVLKTKKKLGEHYQFNCNNCDSTYLLTDKHLESKMTATKLVDYNDTFSPQKV